MGGMNKNKGGYNQYVGRGTSKYEVRMITDGVRVHVDTTERDDDTPIHTHIHSNSTGYRLACVQR